MAGRHTEHQPLAPTEERDAFILSLRDMVTSWYKPYWKFGASMREALKGRRLHRLIGWKKKDLLHEVQLMYGLRYSDFVLDFNRVTGTSITRSLIVSAFTGTFRFDRERG